MGRRIDARDQMSNVKKRSDVSNARRLAGGVGMTLPSQCVMRGKVK